MKKYNVEFQIDHQDKIYSLYGLQITNLEIQNDFFNAHNINALPVINYHYGKSTRSITLQGIYTSSEVQLLLQQLALIKEEVVGTITYNQLIIKENFLIKKYEMQTDYNNINRFNVILRTKQ